MVLWWIFRAARPNTSTGKAQPGVKGTVDTAVDTYPPHDGPVFAGARPQGGDRVAGIVVPLRLVLLLRQPFSSPIPPGTATHPSTNVATKNETFLEERQQKTRPRRVDEGEKTGRPGRPAGVVVKSTGSAVLPSVFRQRYRTREPRAGRPDTRYAPDTTPFWHPSPVPVLLGFVRIYRYSYTFAYFP